MPLDVAETPGSPSRAPMTVAMLVAPLGLGVIPHAILAGSSQGDLNSPAQRGPSHRYPAWIVEVLKW